MNWLNIVIIIVIVISAFGGLKNGLIKAVLSLAGLIVGVVLAGRYYIPLSEQLAFIPQDNIARIVAFAIILIGMILVTGLLASLLTWTVSTVMLGWVNRVGGAVFGLVFGAIFCGALLTIWVKFLGIQSIIVESVVATILLDSFPVVLALLPDEFDAVRSFFQ